MINKNGIKFALIVCTFHRANALMSLLNSVKLQSLYPNQILIIDGSKDSETRDLLEKDKNLNTEYFQVDDSERGLTRQRNFGISRLAKDIDIVCFLDDDIVLEVDYFKNLVGTYKLQPDAVAVGGAIVDTGVWRETTKSYNPDYDEFERDGYVRKLGSRNVLRKRLGLLSNKPPGFMPEFSHGFSTGFLPPTGKIYPVEFFMGGVSSYRKELFSKIKFSSYFEGYGLYEDMEFCLRAFEIGPFYVNTAACCYHYHAKSGRPDYYRYGQMMIKNGFKVWKTKFPNPSLKAKLKWTSINIILILIRLKNGLMDGDHGALEDGRGRISGLFSLIFFKDHG